MHKRFFSVTTVSLLALLCGAGFPVLVFGASDVNELIADTTGLIRQITPIVFTAALLFFFWGLVRYIYAEADDAKVSGRNLMIWGVVALFLASSIGGIVRVLQVTFGVDGGDAGYPHPCIPELGSGSPTCFEPD